MIQSQCRTEIIQSQCRTEMIQCQYRAQRTSRPNLGIRDIVSVGRTQSALRPNEVILRLSGDDKVSYPKEVISSQSVMQ